MRNVVAARLERAKNFADAGRTDTVAPDKALVTQTLVAESPGAVAAGRPAYPAEVLVMRTLEAEDTAVEAVGELVAPLEAPEMSLSVAVVAPDCLVKVGSLYAPTQEIVRSAARTAGTLEIQKTGHAIVP